MVLEAVILCIDNSEWMRNSDFSPSRAETQEDACNLICGSKTRQNQENMVGLITTAGKSVEVCVSLTQDLAKFLTALHKVKIGGTADVVSAIQVAQLALRHRQNKQQQQRIVLFVGSPIKEDTKELVQLGGQLKKNKIAVDIISFGELNAVQNQEKLEAFHKAVNNDNSALVTIPPGTHMLSEHLARTSIVRGEGGAAPAGSTTGGFDFVDENVDPELAMTLKLSLETEEAERKARKPDGGDAPADVQMNEDDPELAEALRQSMMDFEPAPGGSTADLYDDDDDELVAAMRLSHETAETDRENDQKEALLPKDKEPVAAPKADEKPADEQKADPDYISNVFLSLPDIDPNDPEVQALLESMRQQQEDNEKKK